MPKDTKKKNPTFTFETGGDFEQVFQEFQKLCGPEERSAAAMIRSLIRQWVDSKQVSNA